MQLDGVYTHAQKRGASSQAVRKEAECFGQEVL